MQNQLTADPSTPSEELADVAELNEFQQDQSIKFQMFVLREYVANGFVAVDNPYIARTVDTEYSKQLWEKAFADMDLSNFAYSDDEEEEDFTGVLAVTREEANERFGLRWDCGMMI